MNWRRKLFLPDYVLIVANLVPVLGVWFANWSGVAVFTVYALETLIIGIMTVCKMLIITFFSRPEHDWPSQGKVTRQHGLFFILFFMLHFGIFAAVQTAIFSGTAGIAPAGSGPMYFFFHWYEYLHEDTALMLGIFVLSYMGRNLIPFIVNGEYKSASMMIVMFQPYGRIFIQQFTVILGSMFLGFGIDKIFILVFAVAKTFFELYFDFDGLLSKALENAKKNSGQQ